MGKEDNQIWQRNIVPSRRAFFYSMLGFLEAMGLGVGGQCLCKDGSKAWKGKKLCNKMAPAPIPKFIAEMFLVQIRMLPKFPSSHFEVSKLCFLSEMDAVGALCSSMWYLGVLSRV